MRRPSAHARLGGGLVAVLCGLLPACASLPDPPEPQLAARLGALAQAPSAPGPPASEAALVWLDPELQESQPPLFLSDNRRQELLDAVLEGLRAAPFDSLVAEPPDGTLAAAAASGDIGALREAAGRRGVPMLLLLQMRCVSHRAVNPAVGILTYIGGQAVGQMPTTDLGAVATAELCALRTDASSSVCTRGHATTVDGFEPPLSAEITLRELAHAALLEASRQAAADLVRELGASGARSPSRESSRAEPERRSGDRL